MKKISLFLMLIVPFHAFAEDGDWRFYIGVHGNRSWSKLADGNMAGMPGNGTDRNGVQRIDNGNIASNPSFSITAGIDQRIDQWGSRNIKMLVGGELFFDNINHTVVQGDQTWVRNEIFVQQRANANQPIHTTNFLTGIRGKLGLSFFDRFDIYGHGGLAYWDREYYLREDRDAPYWENIEGLQTLPILPFIGIGAKVHVADNWAINASYMKVLPALYDALSDGVTTYNYANNRLSVSMDVVTLGILYYF